MLYQVHELAVFRYSSQNGRLADLVLGEELARKVYGEISDE